MLFCICGRGVIKFSSCTKNACVRWIRVQRSVLTFSTDGAKVVCRRSFAIFASVAGATTEADVRVAKHFVSFVADRVATFAVFCIFQGSVAVLAGVTSRAHAGGGDAIETRVGIAVAVATFTVAIICDGTVGGRACDRWPCATTVAGGVTVGTCWCASCVTPSCTVVYVIFLILIYFVAYTVGGIDVRLSSVICIQRCC